MYIQSLKRQLKNICHYNSVKYSIITEINTKNKIMNFIRETYK